MDPKTLPNLDPKLKEVYERVMGSSISPQSNPPQSTTQTPQPPVQPPPPAPVAPPTQTQPLAQTNTNPVVLPPIPQVPPPPIQKPLNNNGEFHATQVFNPRFSNPNKVKVETPPTTPASATVPMQTPQIKGGFKIGAPFLILVGIVFLILYGLFWVNFFKIPLPF